MSSGSLSGSNFAAMPAHLVQGRSSNCMHAPLVCGNEATSEETGLGPNPDNEDKDWNRRAKNL